MTHGYHFDLLLLFVVIKMTRPIIQRLDHLGLIVAFCREIKLVETIDTLLPKQGKHFISHGQAILGMLLNGLGFHSRTLHMFSHFFKHKPVEHLIGDGIKAEHFNDDALGDTLDKLFDNNVSAIFQIIAAKTISNLGLESDAVHLDITSFHVDGEYKEAEEEDINIIKLVPGYSRDHRPELNQAVLELICENRAGLPIFLKALSGNTNDSKAFHEITKRHINSLKAAQNARYLIADAALYTKNNVTKMDENQQLFISRVPITIGLAKKALLDLDTSDLVEISEGYSGCWVSSNYGEVAQRWLLIKSEQAAKREEKSLKKRLEKKEKEELKAFEKLCKKAFACEKDAQMALNEFDKKCEILGFTQSRVIEIPVFSKAGRPKKEQAPSKFCYQISGKASVNLTKIQLAKSKVGIFILATNELDEKALDMKKLLTNYKSQQKVESGFRFLKNPEFLTSSIYLKNRKRVEALLMIMTLCLLVYAGIEHKMRQELASRDEFFPSMVKNKTTSKPTARWVFLKFEGINLLEQDGKQLIVGLEEYQIRLLKILGKVYEQVYSKI